MKRKIRKVAGVEERVETGAVQFGDDWPGLFIRGDDAMQLVQAIEAIWPDADHDNPLHWGTFLFIRRLILRDVVGQAPTEYRPYRPGVPFYRGSGLVKEEE